MEGTEEWLEEYYRAEDGGKTALLLGRRVEGMADQEVARVNDWVVEEVTKCWKRRKNLMFGEG